MTQVDITFVSKKSRSKKQKIKLSIYDEIGKTDQYGRRDNYAIGQILEKIFTALSS